MEFSCASGDLGYALGSRNDRRMKKTLLYLTVLLSLISLVATPIAFADDKDNDKDKAIAKELLF